MPGKDNSPIYVTKPSLPPLEEYREILKGVWKSGILTHNGPLVQQLEKELKAYLRLKNLVAVTNGTIAIQLALKALNLKGEIITTPFTWIATISAIQWEHFTPVFVDIDPETWNIHPNKIEDAITSRTSAILGVHVFSNPCAVEAIADIAKRHNLKIIYDAAHAVNVNYKGRSLLEYGDISATSFHATKLFNTGEGGACITNSDRLDQRLRRLRFFGHDEEKEIVDAGCNGKMTEIHAALGLANLKYLDRVQKKRKEIFNVYYNNLKSLDFLAFQKIDERAYNYSYMPVVFDSEKRLLRIMSKLNEYKIYTRRYFYPSLNTIKCLAKYRPMPVSEQKTRTILCLPSYTDLDLNIVELICRLIKKGGRVK